MYTPPLFLRNGLAMTVYMGLGVPFHQELIHPSPEPCYQEKIFIGAHDVPIYGWVAIPENPRGTIIGTYGITGTLENQWYLRILGRKAYDAGFAVVLFDWRGHGKTLELSPATTSDGLFEGEDFVHIAAQAKQMGCPTPILFTGYSLGGQVALWAIQSAQSMSSQVGLADSDILGCAVICPNIESNRSLDRLQQRWSGRRIEQAIAKSLKALARQMHQLYPDVFDPDAVSRIHSIRSFDREIVIPQIGFASTEEYYRETSPLYFLPEINKPTLIVYAEDDPLFSSALIPDLQQICQQNTALDLCLTEYGGHVGYQSSRACQQHCQHADPWWAWNYILCWYQHQLSQRLLKDCFQ